jgi:hypothetical protein
LQAPVYVVRVGNPILGNKSSAINVGCGRRLETHEWDVGDVWTIPSVSGVAGIVDVNNCWPTADVAITINASSNNSPVFFILAPTSTAGSAQLSLWEDKGYSQKVTSAGKGQGYEGV